MLTRTSSLLLLLVLWGYTSCTVYENIDHMGEDSPFEAIKYGRIDAFDEIIQDEYVLKAIAFNINDDEKTYKEIIDWSMVKVDAVLKHLKDDSQKRIGKYYKYVLKNIKDFSSKWLMDEIQQLKKKLEDPKFRDDTLVLIKKNIAEYIYFVASDFGMNSVMEGKDTSFKGWKDKKALDKKKKLEKGKEL